MNILAIGAHPDDIEYGCGGTLLLHSRTGDNIYLLVLTEGESAGNAEQRRIEQEEAARNKDRPAISITSGSKLIISSIARSRPCQSSVKMSSQEKALP